MTQEDLDKLVNEVKDLTDDLPFYKQQRLMSMFKETVETMYKKGRQDERYVQKGPTVNLYND